MVAGKTNVRPSIHRAIILPQRSRKCQWGFSGIDFHLFKRLNVFVQFASSFINGSRSFPPHVRGERREDERETGSIRTTRAFSKRAKRETKRKNARKRVRPSDDTISKCTRALFLSSRLSPKCVHCKATTTTKRDGAKAARLNA